MDSLLAELDDSSVSVVPSSYTEAEWLSAVAAIAQDADDGSAVQPELEQEEPTKKMGFKTMHLEPGQRTTSLNTQTPSSHPHQEASGRRSEDACTRRHPFRLVRVLLL